MCWTKLICWLHGHKTGEIYFISPNRFKARCKCGKRDITQPLSGYYGEELPKEVQALQDSLAGLGKRWAKLLDDKESDAGNIPSQ